MTMQNRIGAAAAILYLAAAIYVVWDDRRHPGFLINFGTTLITAPIGYPLEFLGCKPDLRSNLTVTALLLANAALVFGAARFIAALYARR